MSSCIEERNKVRYRNTENLKIDNYTFQRGNKSKYLAVVVTENSEIKYKIKIRITAGNGRYLMFMKLLKSAAVSRKTKLSIGQ